MMNHSKEKMTTQWRCNTKASIGLTWFKLQERERERERQIVMERSLSEREREHTLDRGG